MRQFLLPVSPRDQVLLTRATRPELTGHNDAMTSSDPEAAWLKFRFDQRQRPNSCALVPATLPDLSQSVLPASVLLWRSGAAAQPEGFRAEPEQTETGIRIPLGAFPRGNVNKIQLNYADGARVDISATKARGRFPDQVVLMVEISGKIFTFARHVLQAALRNARAARPGFSKQPGDSGAHPL